MASRTKVYREAWDEAVALRVSLERLPGEEDLVTQVRGIEQGLAGKAKGTEDEEDPWNLIIE